MRLLSCLFLASLAAGPVLAAGEPPSRGAVSNALHRAVAFFHGQVAVEGTYLWQYSEDLSRREGETQATATQAWVQPPGTPAVGLALLGAWAASGDRLHLDAARDAAHGLVRGQLQSGGWTYLIDFSPEGRRRAAYRDGGSERGRKVTTFDDDTTQAALRFLARADAALGFGDAKIREAMEFGLRAVLRAQYPNGAWPQGYEAFPDPARFPVRRATFPDEWPRTWPGSGQYWLRYTLNDNNLATLVETLFEVAEVYAVPAAGTNFQRLVAECRAAAAKAGDFLILAQLPEPQPGWAQQYDFDMHPAWARKFEPPAVTAGESQRALRTLLLLFRRTGQRKYLDPIPAALAWLRRSRLPDGRLARFYEMRSNRPLYFDREYRLTYADTNLPTHYAFKVTDDTEAIAREFESVRNTPDASPGKPAPGGPPALTARMTADALAAMAALDERGRWVEAGRLRTHGSGDPGSRIIRSATFIRHVEALSRYLAATRGEAPEDRMGRR